MPPAKPGSITFKRTRSSWYEEKQNSNEEKKKTAALGFIMKGKHMKHHISSNQISYGMKNRTEKGSQATC